MDNWKPGDVAICVDDALYASATQPHPGRFVKKGERYTILRVSTEQIPRTRTVGPRGTIVRPTRLFLLEIENRYLYLVAPQRWVDYGKDFGFPDYRFRKAEPHIDEQDVRQEESAPVVTDNFCFIRR